jgi:hypothetical protein
MTRKLENLFNLADVPTESKSIPIETPSLAIEEQQKVFDNVNATIDKIDEALPFVHGLDTGDDELDELATMAKNSAQDLLDLGMNMEARFSGTVFQTAGVLLGHAITAKQAKLDKKLRMVDLQLKKLKMDHQIKKDGSVMDEAVPGEGTVIDRNALLAEIMSKSK